MHPELLLVLLLYYLWSPQLTSPTSAQSISGFISLDCGISVSDGPYTDPSTGLVWESDANFPLAAASSTASVSPQPSNLSTADLVSTSQLASIRYFPGNQTKYCYTFDDSTYNITLNATYLVRATFWAGTGFNFTPKSPDGLLRFQLLLNADVWTNVSIPIPQEDVVQKEVYVVALSSSLSVCLSGAGLQSFDTALGAIFDTPFISSLELRQIPIDSNQISPLNEAMRPSSATTRAVHTVYRLDYGSSTGGNSVRYPDDIYDRIWRGQTSTPSISTVEPITRLATCNNVPLVVMQTAYTNDQFRLNLGLPELTGSRGGYAYSLYFAEISENVTASGQRDFNYTVSRSNDTSNGPVAYDDDIDIYNKYGKYAAFSSYKVPPYITLDDGGYIVFDFTKNETSTFGPLLSALELYNVSDHDASLGTHSVDAASVGGVKEAFPSALASWSGDPCLPYPYDWLRCGSLDVDGAPRIISLSLAHKGLSGVIPPAIANLTALQILDLQGNNLSGLIPDFLGSLPNLTSLLLQDNSLSGEIPPTLLEKVASHALNLSVTGNPNLCTTSLENSTSSNTCGSPRKSRTKEIKYIIGGTIGGLCFILLVIVLFCLGRKHLKEKQNGHVNRAIELQETTNPEVATTEDPSIRNLDVNQTHCFSYQEIENITNSFHLKLGEGGFGHVFYGRLTNGVEVAVKVSTENSQHGARQFSNEVELLSRVHHRNLVKLIGYCNETKLMLVYEFMHNGSLDKILQENQPGNSTLTWKHRLRIAIGAADGLEYLHDGCRPPIIHRDVKSGNILLDATMEGKIADFGISRSTRSTLTSMTVSKHMGTPGYLPPEATLLTKINKKFDVYAFVVVLLEIVTGRKTSFIDKNTE